MAEHITLVGGPADGLQVDWKGGDALQWKPSTDHDFVTLRMHSRQPSQHDIVEYRRSRRTRTLFVYQP